MKKFAAALFVAALLPLGGCTVYGLGPSNNPAWANYDFTAQYGLSGYDRPIVYADGYAGGYAYGGGYGGGYVGGYADAYGADVGVGVGGPGFYGSYYSYGGY